VWEYFQVRKAFQLLQPVWIQCIHVFKTSNFSSSSDNEIRKILKERQNILLGRIHSIHGSVVNKSQSLY